MLPTAPSGRGLTREQRLRRRVGRTLAGAGCVEVISFPFVGDADFDAPRACPPTTRAGTPSGWPTRSRTRSRRTPRRCCPACSRRPPATSAAARPGVALFETGTVAFPPTAAPAPIYGVDWRPDRRRAGQAVRGASPTSRCTSPSCSPASASAPAGGATGRAAGWSDAVGLVRAARPTSSASRSRSRRPRRMPWHPGRCAELLRRRRRARPRRRAAPAGLPGVRAAAAQRRRRDRPRRAAAARAVDVVAGTGVLDVPGGEGGRRARRRRVGARRRASRRRCARAPASCSSRSGCSTSTPATRSARARSRWRSRCASAPPTGP